MVHIIPYWDSNRIMVLWHKFYGSFSPEGTVLNSSGSFHAVRSSERLEDARRPNAPKTTPYTPDKKGAGETSF